MSEKIQPSHIEREAYVYIRQSTMQQVRTRLEEIRRVHEGRRTGWAVSEKQPGLFADSHEA